MFLSLDGDTVIGQEPDLDVFGPSVRDGHHRRPSEPSPRISHPRQAPPTATRSRGGHSPSSTAAEDVRRHGEATSSSKARAEGHRGPTNTHLCRRTVQDGPRVVEKSPGRNGGPGDVARGAAALGAPDGVAGGAGRAVGGPDDQEGRRRDRACEGLRQEDVAGRGGGWGGAAGRHGGGETAELHVRGRFDWSKALPIRIQSNEKCELSRMAKSEKLQTATIFFYSTSF